MLEYDLDLYEQEMREEENNTDTIELQFGRNIWEIEFRISDSGKTVTLLGYTFVRNLDNNMSDILTTDTMDNKFIVFLGCEPIKYSRLREIILNNYMR